MRIRTIILIALGLIGLIMWLGYDEQAAYEQCKAAGIQSNETCREYAR